MFKEDNGAVSMRRVLAFIFAVCSGLLFAGGLLAMSFKEVGWIAVLPGTGCLAGTILLLFFTTWNDVASVVSAAKK